MSLLPVLVIMAWIYAYKNFCKDAMCKLHLVQSSVLVCSYHINARETKITELFERHPCPLGLHGLLRSYLVSIISVNYNKLWWSLVLSWWTVSLHAHIAVIYDSMHGDEVVPACNVQHFHTILRLLVPVRQLPSMAIALSPSSVNLRRARWMLSTPTSSATVQTFCTYIVSAS